MNHSHMRFGIITTLCIVLLVSSASADMRICPQFRYALTASTITDTNTLTSFESDLIVPQGPVPIENNINDNTVPLWGIFPFVEPVISQDEKRYGILQPVLEWNYQHQT